MVDLSENPRSTLCSATYHHRISTGCLKYVFRFVGAVDIAIGHDRNTASRLDRGNGVVFGVPAVAIRAGPAMQGQHRDATVLGDMRNRQRIAVLSIPSGTKLQGDRHVHRRHHRFEQRGHQRFIAQQCRATPVIADFFDRAAHVDVDDLGAAINIEFCSFGQQHRIGACNLHGLGLHLAIMIDAPRSLFAGPDTGIGGGHFRHRITGTQLLAQLPKWPVRHARHGRDKHIVAKLIGA